MDDAMEQQYAELLLTRKNFLALATKRKGEIPHDRPSKQILWQQYMTQLLLEKFRGEDKHYIMTTFVPPAYLPCTKSLNELEKIKVKELQLETHHRGRFLLAKCLTPPRKRTAILAIIEDEDGECVLLQLYGREHENDRPAKEILDEGMVLVVKEPYFKVCSEGGYGVRVDHVSDILWLSETDGRVPAKFGPSILEMSKTALKWKEEGDVATKKKKHWDAIKCYTAALKCPTIGATTPELFETIKRNRSQAFLNTKQFDAALEDLSYPSRVLDHTQNEKALFRIAQALYALEEFGQCSNVLNCLVRGYPQNEPAKALSTRVTDRLSEQEGARYNFKSMHGEANRLMPPILDHATFKSQVEVRDSKISGRGLFTTKAVKAGDLLLCEKAVGFSFGDKTVTKAGCSKVTVLINTETNRVKMGTNADLINIIVQKLSKNPSLMRSFTELYHGDYASVPQMVIDGKTVIDTFLIERIIAYNSFGCGISTLVSHLEQDAAKRRPETKPETMTRNRASGIWIIASHINHSCINNCRRSFIGDMQIIRATQDLLADTELVFEYHYAEQEDHDYKKCHDNLKNWGFECSCLLCLEAKNVPKSIATKRKGLFQDLAAAAGGLLQSRDFKKCERLLASLEKTNSKEGGKAPKTGLWSRYLNLARIAAKLQNVERAVRGARKALEMLGFEIIEGNTGKWSIEVKKWGMFVDHVVDCFMLLWTAFALAGDNKGADAARDLAITAYRILMGEDETFEETIGFKAKEHMAQRLLWLGL